MLLLLFVYNTAKVERLRVHTIHLFIRRDLCLG
nr:MAG TPA: hypothetical protein [Myoviridae sp. ctTS62]